MLFALGHCADWDVPVAGVGNRQCEKGKHDQGSSPGE